MSTEIIRTTSAGARASWPCASRRRRRARVAGPVERVARRRPGVSRAARAVEPLARRLHGSRVSRPGGDLTVQGELTAWWASEGFAAPRRAVWSKLTQIEKQSRAFVSRAPARLNRGRGSAGDFAKH